MPIGVWWQYRQPTMSCNVIVLSFMSWCFHLPTRKSHSISWMAVFFFFCLWILFIDGDQGVEKICHFAIHLKSLQNVVLDKQFFFTWLEGRLVIGIWVIVVIKNYFMVLFFLRIFIHTRLVRYYPLHISGLFYCKYSPYSLWRSR